MNRFENVDVLAALEQLMRQNTAFYRNDFEIDKEIIGRAAASDKAEDKTLLWMSRRPGHIVSGKVMCTCKAPRSTTHGSFTGSRPVTGCWPTLWS